MYRFCIVSDGPDGHPRGAGGRQAVLPVQTAAGGHVLLRGPGDRSPTPVQSALHHEPPATRTRRQGNRPSRRSDILIYYVDRFWVHSDRAKAKEKAKFFFEVCRLFFDLFACSLISLSPLLSLGVNWPLGSIHPKQSKKDQKISEHGQTIKRQPSKKMFTFSFAFARSECAFKGGGGVTGVDISYFYCVRCTGQN